MAERTRAKSTTRWIVGIIVGLGTVIGVAGLIYESMSASAARRNYPPPGELVDVGSYRLHLHSMGEKRANVPTILLEHGGGSFSAQWGWIQPILAQHTQVVAYDRPGMGWSESSPDLLDAEAAVHDLHAALSAAEIEGPYLLVGHSLGGLLVRVFARLYPQETAGLVLIDPVTVERHELLPYGMDDISLGIIRALARLGGVRLAGLAETDAAPLPELHRNQTIAIAAGARHMGNLGQEGRLGESSMEFLRQGERLDDVPLLILEAGAPGEGFDAAQRAVLSELYAKLAAQSNHGRLNTVPGAGHATIVTQAEHAQVVNEAIITILEEDAP